MSYACHTCHQPLATYRPGSSDSGVCRTCAGLPDLPPMAAPTASGVAPTARRYALAWLQEVAR
ncbi:MAG: hypothetical protein ACTHQ3_08615 [Motilibacteraceae bacterium]